MGRQKTGRPRDPSIVRLSDVAKRAGCSAATVSRVLNKPDRVDPAARKRVDAAIEELGYLRNGAARALRSRRTRTIGAIIPTLDRHLRPSPERARPAPASMAIPCWSPPQASRSNRAAPGPPAGGAGCRGHRPGRPYHSAALYTALETNGIPFVNTYTYKPDSPHASVGFDNRAASRQIVDYLIDLGHRDFAIMVGFQKDNDRVKDRVAGALDAIAARRIATSAPVVVEEPYSIEGGREGLRRILGATLARRRSSAAATCWPSAPSANATAWACPFPSTCRSPDSTISNSPPICVRP
jgi:LacI family transcriptional regulator